MIALFQLSLARGAPFGSAALGEAHQGPPANLRVVSAVATAIWLLAALVVMGRAGLQVTPLPNGLIRPGAWILVSVLAAGAVLNFASSSPRERFMGGPFSTILAGLCALIAGADPVAS